LIEDCYPGIAGLHFCFYLRGVFELVDLADHDDLRFFQLFIVDVIDSFVEGGGIFA